jgi:hypothetical protein
MKEKFICDHGYWGLDGPISCDQTATHFFWFSKARQDYYVTEQYLDCRCDAHSPTDLWSKSYEIPYEEVIVLYIMWS